EKEKLVLLYPTNKAEVEQLRQASLKAVAEGKTYEDPRLEVYTQPCCGRLTPVNIGGLVGLRNGLPAGQRGTDLDLNYSYLGSKWLPIASGGTNEPDVLMDAAEVYFLRAEGALRGWSMGGMVKDLYNEGIRMSINAKTTVSDGVID